MNIKLYKLNKKGFNLFTALVSLILISIALVLVFNMIKTEETYISVIEDQSQNSDLITVADLARADAYDLFVISLREKWEDMRSNNTFIINRELVDYNWPTFVDEMANRYFFELSFSEFFAQSLLNKLNFTVDPVGYKVSCVINNGNDTDVESFAALVQEMFDDSEDKVDVVNCKQDDENCVGSFYLKLTSMNLSDENFERLPQIMVLRYKNNEVIERPVFGRQVYKIYMPWRGFQAFRTARRIAHSADVEKSDSPGFATTTNDLGLFNPKIHNVLEQARLGICDRGSCGPRTDFFKTSSKKGFNKSCEDTTAESTVSTQGITVENTNIGLSSLGNYNIHTEEDYETNFNNLIENTVRTNLDSRADKIVFNNGLQMIGTSYGDVNINDVKARISSKKTKQITSKPGDAPTISPMSQQSFSLTNSTNLNNDAGGIGLFNDNGIIKRGYDIDNTWNNDQPPVTLSDSVGADLKCYELEGIDLNLTFKENDVKYKVNDTRDVIINVKLVDSYSGFKFTPVLSGSNILSLDEYGYYNMISASQLSHGWNIEDWKCNTYDATGPANRPGCTPD